MITLTEKRCERMAERANKKLEEVLGQSHDTPDMETFIIGIFFSLMHRQEKNPFSSPEEIAQWLASQQKKALDGYDKLVETGEWTQAKFDYKEGNVKSAVDCAAEVLGVAEQTRLAYNRLKQTGHEGPAR